MEKKFKHRKTDEIITYKDGVIKSGTLALDMGCEPSSEYWEEVKKTYPIGTKVRDWLGKIYEKKEDGWFRTTALLALNESEIGEGKYYQVIEEPKNYHVSLNSIKHIKQPLFTTEDGVDIFKGDFYIMVSNDLFEVRTLCAMGNEIANIKRFSTEDAAREYLMWNKPVLSLKDVASIYPGVNKNHNAPSHQAEQLKELVKSKL